MTQQPKTLENQKIVDIKSLFIEHAKACHKLRKTIKQVEKASLVSVADKSSTSPLYSETKQVIIFLTKKGYKIYKNNETITCL